MNNKQTDTSNNGKLSDGTLLARQVRYSGKYLTETRSDAGEESQRRTAVNIIRNNANDIKRAAAKYGVTPEAIATAIAWEGAENNNRFAGTPGRVHNDTARSIYNIDKRIPRDYTPDRIGEPKVAIEYIGAIMRDNANVYKNNSGIDISRNTPLLADLYQNGSAARLGKQIAKGREEDRRAGRPLRQPRIAEGVNGMGEYAQNGVNSAVISQWLGTTKDIYGPHGMNQSPNNSVAALTQNNFDVQQMFVERDALKKELYDLAYDLTPGDQKSIVKTLSKLGEDGKEAFASNDPQAKILSGQERDNYVNKAFNETVASKDAGIGGLG
jgi:Protein of unknown function (DUF1402)